MSRAVLGIICCLLVAIPYLAVHFPPIADLPQQVAQIKLFLETIRDPGNSPYRIQYWGNGTLHYALLGIGWALFDPVNAGKLAMLAVALLWVIAIHLTALVRNRPSEAAVLASLFVFNHLIYWGFYGFAIGWPTFLLWFHLLRDESFPSSSPAIALASFGAGLLLYMSHVLWLLAGIAWLLIRSAAFRAPLRDCLLRLASIGPLIVLMFFWYAGFRDSAMTTPAEWIHIPILGRISLPWVLESALGGLQGVTDFIFGAVIIAWIIAAAIRNKTNFLKVADKELVLAAGMFLVFGLVLPDKYMNTIMFSNRWIPGAMIMLILAMPPLAGPAFLRQIGALVLLALFCAITSSTWMLFERQELAGLEESLAVLPFRSKVLGLDMVRTSQYVKGTPFLHQFAYSQALKDCSVNFSFAQFPSSLVVYKKPFRSPWTRSLEWFPWKAKEADLNYFDYVLVNGDRLVHMSLRDSPQLTCLTNQGNWRAYAITHNGARLEDGDTPKPTSRLLFRKRSFEH